MGKQTLRDTIKINLNAKEEIQWDILNLDFIIQDQYDRIYRKDLDRYIKILHEWHPDMNIKKIILSFAGTIMSSNKDFLMLVDNNLRSKNSEELHIEKSILLARGIIALHRNKQKNLAK